MKRKFAAVSLVVMILFVSACGGIKINPNITGDTLVLILEEAGYDLAYLGLKSADDVRLARIREAITKAESMIGDRDITKIVAAVSNYIAAMPEFQIDDTYQFIVRRATRLLDKIVDIDISVPDEVETAEEYAKAFLRGGKDGIDDLLM